MDLVVGHNHSRTKTPRSKKMKFKDDFCYYIGFRISEIPNKYYKEYERPKFNHKGYSYYHVLDHKDYERF